MSPGLCFNLFSNSACASSTMVRSFCIIFSIASILELSMVAPFCSISLPILCAVPLPTHALFATSLSDARGLASLAAITFALFFILSDLSFCIGYYVLDKVLYILRISFLLYSIEWSLPIVIQADMSHIDIIISQSSFSLIVTHSGIYMSSRMFILVSQNKLYLWYYVFPILSYVYCTIWCDCWIVP